MAFGCISRQQRSFYQDNSKVMIPNCWQRLVILHVNFSGDPDATAMSWMDVPSDKLLEPSVDMVSSRVVLRDHCSCANVTFL